MRRLLQFVSWLALLSTITPAVLFMTGRMTLDQSKLALFVATVAWFVATPLWMGRPKINEELVI